PAWRTFGVQRLSARCILSLMPPTATFHESRRSTRVPLKVVITVEGGAGSRTCDGETIVVNLHGVLIATAIGLSSGNENLDSRLLDGQACCGSGCLVLLAVGQWQFTRDSADAPRFSIEANRRPL